MSNADNINNLLIIAGRDNYPKIIMEAAKKSGVKKIHVIAFKGETKKRNLNLADSISWNYGWSNFSKKYLFIKT